jgi:chromosome segregation ATPase
MSITKELKLLRVELRDLRQQIARVTRAWQNQKQRADRLELENKELKQENLELKKGVSDLEQKLVSS